MERKRSWLRSFCDKEEEEGTDRRRSLREKKIIRYASQDGDDDDGAAADDDHDVDDDDREEEEKHNHLTDGNRILVVTCGNKKGKLHVEKLERGEECIECEGSWFCPSAFENLCGKGAAKKWKSSILYNDEPLQFWFDQGCLFTKGYKKKGTTIKKEMIQPSDFKSETCSEETDQNWIIPTNEILASHVKVMIKRLPLTSWMESRAEETLCVNGRSEEETENSSDEDDDKAAATGAEPPPVSDSAVAADFLEENGEEFMHSDEMHSGQSELRTETPECSLGASFTERGLVDQCSHRSIKEDGDDTDEETEGEKLEMLNGEEKEEKKRMREEHFHMSDSEKSAPTGKKAKTSHMGLEQPSTREEDLKYISSYIIPVTVLDEHLSEGHADVTTSDHDTLELQIPDTRSLPEPDGTHPSPPAVRAGSDVADTLDMSQLQREIMYMQIKVLKLQEEYYTLRLKEMKKTE